MARPQAPRQWQRALQRNLQRGSRHLLGSLRQHQHLADHHLHHGDLPQPGSSEIHYLCPSLTNVFDFCSRSHGDPWTLFSCGTVFQVVPKSIHIDDVWNNLACHLKTKWNTCRRFISFSHSDCHLPLESLSSLSKLCSSPGVISPRAHTLVCSQLAAGQSGLLL